MTNSDPWDRFVHPYLTLMSDSYSMAHPLSFRCFDSCYSNSLLLILFICSDKVLFHEKFEDNFTLFSSLISFDPMQMYAFMEI